MSLQERERISTVKSHGETYPFLTADFEVSVGIIHTWLGQGEQVRHVLHEDAPLQLQLGFAALVDELFVGEFVLGLAEVDVLAAKQDGFEKVDVVLVT